MKNKPGSPARPRIDDIRAPLRERFRKAGSFKLVDPFLIPVLRTWSEFIWGFLFYFFTSPSIYHFFTSFGCVSCDWFPFLAYTFCMGQSAMGFKIQG
jgi:hypothetical protein